MYKRWPALAAFVIVLVASGSAAYAPEAPAVRIVILHTNDLHGRLLPFAYAEAGRGNVEREGVGGAARRATLIRRLKRQAPESTLLVDAGDVFTRGALTNAYEGLADIAAMNATGYQLAAIGNNEFKAKDGVDAADWAGSQKALLKVVRASRFPWLCANLADSSGKPPQGIRPTAVMKVGGLRVGFVGLTAPRSASYPQTRGWKITDPIAAAKVWVPKLRRQCDVVVALTHVGVILDHSLAAAVDGIDAIVGGDSHTFLYQPVWVKSPSGRRVPIAQDGEYGGNVGKLELKFVRGKDGYRLSDARGELVPVSADIPEASDVRRALEPYVRPYLTKIGRLDRVGATPDERRQVTTRIVVEAIRKATGAEMALNPAGQGLIDVFHHAVVTRYDLYQAMPFHNVAVTVQLTGPEIEQILARYPSAVTSGMPSRLEGGRTYRVAMVDFVAREVCPAPTLRIVQTGPDVRKAVENYFRAGVDSYTSSATPGLSVISTLRPRSMSSEPRAVLTALPDRSRTR